MTDPTIRERLRELADGVRYAGGNGTSDYWRGFNDGIDRLLDDPAIGTELDTLERRAIAAEEVFGRLYDTTRFMRAHVGHTHLEPYPCPVFKVDNALNAAAAVIDPTFDRPYPDDLRAWREARTALEASRGSA